jgi:nicotinate-nucleotide adenylyltransferase
VASAVPRVVLVGGSFDPPHRAHVELPRRYRDRFEPGAWLVYVPAAVSAFKGGGARASGADRVAMLRLAVAGVPSCAVWTDEVDRAAREPGVSYTVDTLKRAGEVAPWCGLTLLIGSDQAAALHRWREVREVCRRARVEVLLRPPLDTPEKTVRAMRGSGAWSEEELAEFQSRMTRTAVLGVDGVSSTRVRERIGGRDEPGEIDAAVARYIRERGLYGAGGAS